MSKSSSSSEASHSKIESSFGESFESKASDQRQLLTEMNTPAPKRHGDPEPAKEDETDLWGAVSEEQDEQHPMSDASYAGSSPEQLSTLKMNTTMKTRKKMTRSKTSVRIAAEWPAMKNT